MNEHDTTHAAESPVVSTVEVVTRGSDLTARQRDALLVLASAPDRGLTPSEFAVKFWPGKVFARSNGPWGLGPDASGRHGGRMLTRLNRMGLVRFLDHDGYYSAALTEEGREAVSTVARCAIEDDDA